MSHAITPDDLYYDDYYYEFMFIEWYILLVDYKFIV
jgi:hypothetical protein